MRETVWKERTLGPTYARPYESLWQFLIQIQMINRTSARKKNAMQISREATF
jgi:hypothetical protein